MIAINYSGRYFDAASEYITDRMKFILGFTLNSFGIHQNTISDSDIARLAEEEEQFREMFGASLFVPEEYESTDEICAFLALTLAELELAFYSSARVRLTLQGEYLACRIVNFYALFHDTKEEIPDCLSSPVENDAVYRYKTCGGMLAKHVKTAESIWGDALCWVHSPNAPVQSGRVLLLKNRGDDLAARYGKDAFGTTWNAGLLPKDRENIPGIRKTAAA